MKKQVDKYFCDFCELSQDDVELMVAGPGGSAICDSCTELAMEIVRKRRDEKARLAKASDENLR